ncbi:MULTISPECIES: AAA family ATPase [unclassified Rhizobium]|uniref:AAA family ATPase n=1 Tax=unclassified Rhizobium TaxID=2613769 RepID=UPI0007EB22F0|nr:MULTISPECIES: ATP-binding protein [unclassified Rhizobium]
MRRKSDEGVSALARIACAISLRETLTEAKKLHENGNFAYVVRVPLELSKDYVAAAADLAEMLPGVKAFEVAAPFQTSRGKTDFGDVTTAIRNFERVLVFVPENLSIPRSVFAASDIVVDAKPIDGPIVAQALRLLDGQEYPTAAIEEMLSYPIADVVGAFRPGRTADETLARLKEAHRRYASLDDPPRVEELHGYGAAAEWALDLAADLDAWRRGNIPWAELDSGLLLSGPPGVGKSMFAKAAAKSCGVAFVASSLAQWQSRGHLGDLLGAMRATFAEAASKSPCILLLDEFDSVGDRTTFRKEEKQYCTEVIAGLLECLDGVMRREGIVVIGACDHPDTIDDALLRPGRLGTHIRIGLPDADARRGILGWHLRGVIDDAQVAAIAAECEGFSGGILNTWSKAPDDGRDAAGSLSP